MSTFYRRDPGGAAAKQGWRGEEGCAAEVEEKEVFRGAQRTASRSHSSSLPVSAVPRGRPRRRGWAGPGRENTKSGKGAEAVVEEVGSEGTR